MVFGLLHTGEYVERTEKKREREREKEERDEATFGLPQWQIYA